MKSVFQNKTSAYDFIQSIPSPSAKYFATHYQITTLWLWHLNCSYLKQSRSEVCTGVGGVNNLKRKEQILILHRPTSAHHQYKLGCTPMTQRQALPVSSMRYPEGERAPDWWFHDFEPVWRSFIQSLGRQKNVTMLEFEQAASQVPGLTHIEKTIAISAFRQQQEQRLAPSHATAFRSERHLSVV